MTAPPNHSNHHNRQNRGGRQHADISPTMNLFTGTTSEKEVEDRYADVSLTPEPGKWRNPQGRSHPH